MPLMVLKQKNYLHNLKTFSNYLEKHNLDIAPHGKTTMAPQIFSEQIKHGAWGITLVLLIKFKLCLILV